MPTLEFVTKRGTLQVNAEAGGDLLDLCEAAGAPVPFSCRSGTCGTCQVAVLEGAELLSRMTGAERDTLSRREDAAESRLTCQVTLHPGAGVVRLRSLFSAGDARRRP